MSMPPPRFMGIGVGCVVKYSKKPSGPPTLTIAASVNDIMALDPYFTTTIAKQIYAYSLKIVPNTSASVGDIVFTDQTIDTSAGGFRIVSLAKKKKGLKSIRKPKSVPQPIDMKDGCCYWLEPIVSTKKKK